MTKIVLVGNASPIKRIAENLLRRSDLRLCGVFLDPVQSPGLEGFLSEAGVKVLHMDALDRAPGSPEFDGEQRPDWLFNVNSDRIIGPDVLAWPTCGALNVHYGKLPEYAGRHTHQWAIRNGERTFTTTLHWMAEKVDAGGIALERTIEILPEDSGLSLLRKWLDDAARIVIEALDVISSTGDLPCVPQDLSRRRLYLNRDAVDGRINWSLPGRAVCDFVRAADYLPLRSPSYVPCTVFNGAAFEVYRGRPVEGEVTRPGTVCGVSAEGVTVATGDGTHFLMELIGAGGKKLKGAEISAFLQCKPGSILG